MILKSPSFMIIIILSGCADGWTVCILKMVPELCGLMSPCALKKKKSGGTFAISV